VRLKNRLYCLLLQKRCDQSGFMSALGRIGFDFMALKLPDLIPGRGLIQFRTLFFTFGLLLCTSFNFKGSTGSAWMSCEISARSGDQPHFSTLIGLRFGRQHTACDMIHHALVTCTGDNCKAIYSALLSILPRGI